MGIKNRPAFDAGLLLDEHQRPGSVTSRRARVHEPHVAALTDHARSIALALDEHVPDFDPDSGGQQARVLVLLQDPSRTAAFGSRMISIHNNDLTAGNTFRAYVESGLDYRQAVHWNVVPWWVADPDRQQEGVKRTLTTEARRARAYLRELFALLPDLRVVVLLGDQAKAAHHAAAIDAPIRVLTAPHPSPRAWNKLSKDGRPNSQLTIEAFKEAARVAYQPPNA